MLRPLKQGENNEGGPKPALAGTGELRRQLELQL